MPWWEDCSFSSWFWSGHCQNAFRSKDVSATFTQKRCNPAVQLFLIAFTSTLDTDLRQDHVGTIVVAWSYISTIWSICTLAESWFAQATSLKSHHHLHIHLPHLPHPPIWLHAQRAQSQVGCDGTHWAKGQSWRIDRAGDLDHPSGTRHRSRGRGPGRSLWCLGRNASQLFTIRKYRNPLRSCSIAAPNPPQIPWKNSNNWFISLKRESNDLINLHIGVPWKAAASVSSGQLQCINDRCDCPKINGWYSHRDLLAAMPAWLWV